jgi:hypothetical protein
MWVSNKSVFLPNFILSQKKINIDSDAKIPNFKHQSTNKSQISRFNAQKIPLKWVESIGKSMSAGDDVIGNKY